MIWLVLLGCPRLEVPHEDGAAADFPLTGGHLLNCGSCHEDPNNPTALPSACVNCHAEEILPAGHTSATTCEGCHVVEGWGVGVVPGTGTDTGTTDTDTDTTDTDTDVGFDHSTLSESQQCQACHDQGASNPFRPPDHNLGADCGPCHQTTGWTDSPIQHPAPTPHGGSVVACSECHPSGPPGIDCVTCHLDDKLASSHNGFGPSSEPAASTGCLPCHPDARY